MYGGDAQNFGRASLYKGFWLNCVPDDSKVGVAHLVNWNAKCIMAQATLPFIPMKMK